MVAPKPLRKSQDFVQHYAAVHENELNICRHALLSCRKNAAEVEIGNELVKVSTVCFNFLIEISGGLR